MTTGETLYTGRTTRPDVLEVGRDNLVTMEVRRSGALVLPSLGTLTLYDRSGTSIATPAVTFPGDIATATIAAVDLPSTLTRGVRYLQVWSLTVGGTVREFPRESTVAKRALLPVVAVVDLLARYPTLDSEFGTTPLVRLQGFLDEAWAVIVNRLQAGGILAEYIVTTEATRGSHIHLALSLAFGSLDRMEAVTGLPSRFRASRDFEIEQYKAAWGSMTFRRDIDGDGFADSDSRLGAPNDGLVQRNVPPRRKSRRSRAW